MKILFQDKLYSGLMDTFYMEKQVDDVSYIEHIDKLVDFSLQWFPSLYLEAKHRNHYAELVIYNDEMLQKKWATSNNIPYNRKLLMEISYEQIKKFQPDVYFYAGSTNYYKTFYKRIKPYVGKIVCWLSAAFPDNMDLSAVDIMISDNDKILNYSKRRGIQAEKMISAIPAECIKFSKYYIEREKELIFTGSMGRQFNKRRRILKYLTDNSLNINIYGHDLSEDSSLAIPIERLLKRILSNRLYKKLYEKKILPINNPLKRYMCPPVYGRNMIQLLGDSKMVLNMHSDFDIDYAINMRVFEGLAAGSLLFTEKNSAVKQFFQDSEDLIVYNDAKDLVQKVEYFSRNPEEAESIAQEGQRKIQKNHLVSHRFDEFISIVT